MFKMSDDKMENYVIAEELKKINKNIEELNLRE